MKPRVLILGGCGFIGRNLVDHLIREDLVEEIRVVDKVPPQIAWLNNRHKDSFEDPRVSFLSANLSNPESCKVAFSRDDAEVFDFVVNCACQTRLGQSEPVYSEGILKLSMLCAKEADKVGVKRFLELSEGQMASSKEKAHKESDKRDPWTCIARWKSKVEDELMQIKNLDYVILRPAIVYGFGDRAGLVPLLLLGSIYQHLGECLKLLWSRDLLKNTVHVKDVCRAIWHILNFPEASRQVYNVVDEGNSSLGLIADFVSTIFNVPVDFWGTALSTIAKADMENIVNDINDKHLGPWAEMCTSAGITNTPLSPFLDKEALSKNHTYLDGKKLLSTGFTYSIPNVTLESLKEILQDYSERNLFPVSIS